tara:strand:- start:120604 stop:121221 length:618 start_codon:yes stop_codon:yes gene_type:complete
MFQFQPKLIAFLTGVGLVIVAAVYLMLGPQINGEGGTASGNKPLLASMATGHMANFIASDSPKPVPDLEFLAGNGETVRLSDFQGKVVLLNLWATWCVPCREEMPALDGLEGDIGSDKFQVLALSVDKDGLDLARDFLASVNATHIALYNDPTSSANFKVKGYGLPTTLLLAPDGMELGRIVGPAEWNTDDAKALIGEAVRLYAH